MIVNYAHSNINSRLWLSLSRCRVTKPRNSNTFSHPAVSDDFIQTQQQILRKCIQNLHKHILTPQVIDSDDILSQLNTLHLQKVVIPNHFVKQAILVFIQRSDPWRLELLLRMYEKNVLCTTTLFVATGDSANTWRKTVVFAIENLYKSKRGTIAINLFRRLEFSNEKLSLGLGDFFRDLVISKTRTTFELTRLLHELATVKLFNQGIGYYSKLLESYECCLKLSVVRRQFDQSFQKKVALVKNLFDEVRSFHLKFHSKIYGDELHLIIYRFINILVRMLDYTQPSEKTVAVDCANYLRKFLYVPSKGTSSMEGRSLLVIQNHFRSLYPEISYSCHHLNEDVLRSETTYTDRSSFRQLSVVKIDETIARGLSSLIRNGLTDDAVDIFSKFLEWKIFRQDGMSLDHAAVSSVAARLLDAYPISVTFNEGGFDRNPNQFENLDQFALLLVEQMKRKGFDILHGFYVAWFRARFLSSSDRVKSASLFVNDYVTTVSDIMKLSGGITSPAVPMFDELIRLICDRKKSNSLFDALYVAQGLKERGIQLLPSTWSRIIDAANKYLTQVDHKVVIKQLESTLKDEGRGLLDDGSILIAFFASSCRAAEPFKAIQQLQYIRSKGFLTNYDMYDKLLAALTTFKPEDKNDFHLVTNPMTTCSWILRDMIRDSVAISPELLVKLMKLFTKAAYWTRWNDGVFQILTDGEKLIKACSDGSTNCPKVAINENVVREFLSACAIGMDEERLMRVFETYHVIYKYERTAKTFEVILRMYAKGRKSIDFIDDFISQLSAEGINVTPNMIDSLVRMLIERNCHPEALDRIQEIYNQHGVKPLAETTLRLLDESLKNGDEHEARRVVAVIEQIYTDTERKTISINAPNISEMEYRDEDVINLDSLLISENRLDRVLTGKSSANLQLLRAESDESSIQSKEKEYLLNVRNPTPYVVRTWASKFGPRVYGVFTRENLEERFRMFGVQLNK